MKGDQLPAEARVVHYVSSSRWSGKRVSYEAFKKATGKPPSVHWLEKLGETPEDQLAAVRAVSRLKFQRHGCFAELRVGDVMDCDDALKVVHDPLPGNDDYPPDPSHSNIIGMPQPGAANERIVCELLARRVTVAHAAVVQEQPS